MKIGIIGATGKAGKCIFREATARGHEVTAIIRDSSKVATPGLDVLVKDAFDLTVQDLQRFDVVVNAFGTAQKQGEQHVALGHHLINLFRDLPNTRLIIVGSAGSLFIDSEKTCRIADSPKLPVLLKESFLAQTLNLMDYENTDIRWTFISPALFFDAAGVQTDSYIKGNDQAIFNNKGYSYISYYDYALAVVDEIEQASHPKQRFCVVAEVGKSSLMTTMMNKTMNRVFK